MSSSREIIYLDHAATSWPKPESVRQRANDCYTDLFANSGRSGYAASVRSAEMVFETRQNLASLLGAADSRDVVFTSGATEGINLVLKGFLDSGDLVFVSPMEHNSVMRPLRGLARERSIRVETMPADRLGAVDWDAAGRMARRLGPRLAVVAHASNVNGVVQDLSAAREALGEVPILVDAAQTAGVLPIRAEADGLDFVACSAHKGLLGPTGLGACYLGGEHDVGPLLEGGTGSRSADVEQPPFRPDRYEAGTQNLHGIAALSGALGQIASAGLAGGLKRELTAVLIEGLRELPGVRLHCPVDGSAILVAITVDGLPPDRVASVLERDFGVLCRPGLQCAPAAHRHLGTYPVGTVRLSPGPGNTERQMRHVLDAVGRVASEGRR